MVTIGISEVLDRINDTVDIHSVDVKHYRVKFYTAEGEKRELMVRKYTRGSLQLTNGQQKRGKASHNLQKNGLVMLQDLTNGRTINIRPTSIYGFSDYQSDQWLKVYH